MNESTNYQERLSAAITWLRFPLIFFIIMLHCYSVQRLEGNHATYFKALYPFSLWLGETGVPGYFFISGYLFFLSKKSYQQKLKARIHTLLIPYLLWNFLMLTLYLSLSALGYPISICSKNITDYGFIDYLRLFWDRGDFGDGNFAPLLCPLWYIRNLFIISLLSPFFYYIIKYVREVFLLVVLVWWLMLNHNAFVPQTILFFCLGAYFSIFGINPLKYVSEHQRLFLLLFCLFAIADIFVHVAVSTPVNLKIHRLALFFNIPALLLLADRLTGVAPSRIQYLSQATFIVFCIHYPIVLFLRKACISTFVDASDTIHISLYFVCVILVTSSSIVFYQILNRYFPITKKILSGNR